MRAHGGTVERGNTRDKNGIYHMRIVAPSGKVALEYGYRTDDMAEAEYSFLPVTSENEMGARELGLEFYRKSGVDSPEDPPHRLRVLEE